VALTLELYRIKISSDVLFIQPALTGSQNEKGDESAIARVPKSIATTE